MMTKTPVDQKPVGGKVLSDFQRKMLEKALQEDLSELLKQRIKIMLLTDEGKTQTEICKALGCSQATARHWIVMARSNQAHKWRSNVVGRPKTVNDCHLARLKELVNSSPKDFGYSFRRWTAQWLAKHLAKEFGVNIGVRHVNRLLKEMGLSTKSQPDEDVSEMNIKNAIIVIRDLKLTPNPEKCN